MSDPRATAPLLGGVALLERAMNYTLGSLHLVTREALGHRTPCRHWDLHDLLRHMDDSLAALCEAVDLGYISAEVVVPRPGVDPVAGLRDRACRVLGVWTSAEFQSDLVSVAGCPLTASIVSTAGAVEVAVHGWDVAQASGRPHPIPESLAEELLELTPLLVTEADRPERFGVPVQVPPTAPVGDRLVGFLGREPA